MSTDDLVVSISFRFFSFLLFFMDWLDSFTALNGE